MTDRVDYDEEEQKQAVLDNMQRLIHRIGEMQTVVDHLKAGGSYNDEIVRSSFGK